jgi:hypothetical protein
MYSYSLAPSRVGQENAGRGVAKQDGYTELSLVWEMSSPGDAAYRWCSEVLEDAPARNVLTTVHGEVRAARGSGCRERSFHDLLQCKSRFWDV